jgi:hypothetical protein
VEFPFPSWATRADEAPRPDGGKFQPDDPWEGLSGEG